MANSCRQGQRSYLAKNIEYLVVELAGNVRELRG